MQARRVAKEIAGLIAAKGHQAWFAGGCVRDTLLGKEPHDFDIATSALPEEVVEWFPGANQVGAHFGVVIVKRHGVFVEIATFRTDGSYRDGRRPEQVRFSTPEEDAQRRDFTINGMFEVPETGEVVDFVGGRADLEARVLRAIGDPHARFREDSLRLLRAVRFANSLGFQMDPVTEAAVVASAPQLARISEERVRDEFSRIIGHPSRRDGISQLVDLGLMRSIAPEFLETIGCEQPPEWHPEGDVYVHTLIMLGMLEPDAPLDLCLAVFFHDIAKPPTRTIDSADGRIRFNGHDRLGAKMAATIMRRLRYPNDLTARVCSMVERHMQFMNVQKMRVAKLKRFMAAETFAEELELHRVDCASSNGFTDNLEFLIERREAYADEPLLPPPLVSGRDLIDAGLRPGPIFKSLLEELQTEQLEGRISDREQGLEMMRALISARRVESEEAGQESPPPNVSAGNPVALGGSPE